MRQRFLTYTERTGKPSTNENYHTFLCDCVETELRKGSDLYNDLEQEWGLLKHYYEIEATRATEQQQPYEPFRLWVLLDFIFKLKE